VTTKLIPAHTVIGFSIRHNEITLVTGRFKEFTGAIHYDPKDVTKSSVEFKAKVESIDTGVEARDKHLRTADFFEGSEIVSRAPVLRGGLRVYSYLGDLLAQGKSPPRSRFFEKSAVRRLFCLVLLRRCRCSRLWL